MANTVTSHDLKHGRRWTFVHSNGRRTEYVYEDQIVPKNADPKTGTALDAMHKLLNPETGKFAQVSEKWLCEGKIGEGRQGYWEPAAVEMAKAA